MACPPRLISGTGKGGAEPGCRLAWSRVRPDGINPGMFQQKQVIFPFRVFLMGPDQLFLKFQGFLIVCQAGNADDVHAAAGATPGKCGA